LLVHLIDGSARDPLGDYETINRELAAFSEQLALKPQIVVVNKADIPDVAEMWPLIQDALDERGISAHLISAATGQGVRDLLWSIAHQLSEIPDEILVEAVDEEPEVDEKAFTVSVDEDGWHVRGVAIERTALMTNWDQQESLARFQRVLEAMGITIALREAGVVQGDTVFIGKTELQWGWEPT
jgi:GTP-binding protein